MTSSALPSWDDWLALPDEAVAAHVRPRRASLALCLDATRRWFHFDYLAGGPVPPDPRLYLTAGAEAYARLIALLFEHGIDPLFIPLQVPLRRGAGYAMRTMVDGLALLNHASSAARPL